MSEAECRAVEKDQSDSPEPVSGKGTSWGFSWQDLEEAQGQEEDFHIVLEWLKYGTPPDDSELFRSNAAVKFYWLSKEQLCLINNVIYYVDGRTGDKRLLLPTSMRELALRWHHAIPSAGHQGIKRTKERMKEKFIWYGMGKDVTSYVVGCEPCNRNKKTSPHGKCPMTEFQAGIPMERVHIDFLGPLPKTKAGNKYILMMVDQFTKWVECVALPDQTAETTAKAIVDNWFCRLGVPLQILTDQGRNFESQLFAELCKIFEVRKTRTTPYRPSANGQVERYNRTLMDAIRCYTGKSQNNWDQYLQQIAGSLRSAVNRQTGFSANKLVFGHEINIPAGLMFPRPIRDDEEVLEYFAELVQQIQEAHEIARKTLMTSTKRMKKNYDLKILEKSYEVGDAVYLLDTSTEKGKCKKLSPPWKGPAVICEKISSYLFRVKLRNSVFVVNHDRLKPCRDKSLPQWILHYRKSNKTVPVLTDDKLYCFCRNKDDGRFMIQCDFCSEWYHGSCVNISPSEAVSIDKYKCKDCQQRQMR
jgi:transposase InsO family protein